MTFPQNPVQGYPAYPGYGDPQPKPSGATAITAAVLAILGGLVAVLGAIGSFIGLAALSALESQPSDFNSQYGSTTNLETGLPDWFGAYVIVSGIVNLIVAILLLVGAIMVIMKKSAGLFMVIAGCALVIIAGVGGFIASSSITADLPDGGMSMAGSAVGLVLLMFPVATLVLAAVPPTARWCAQGNAPVAAPAFGQPGGMYPPSGGYGQPGQDPRHPGQAPQQW